MTATPFLVDLVHEVLAIEPCDEDLEAARLRLFDAALVWAATRTAYAQEFHNASRPLLGEPSANAAPAACLVELAARGRSTEVDDIHLASCTTPGMVVLPTVVALAPLAGQRPAAVALRAIVAGYEAVTRAAAALGGPGLLAKGIWPSRAVAPLGAAITASSLLGLAPDQAVEAAGLAACSGSEGAVPEPARELTFASAVLSGAGAAVAARAGVRSGEAPLARWVTRTSGGACSEPLPRDERGRLAVIETCVKPFCGARQSLAATAAVQHLVQDGGIAARDVTAIRVGVPTIHAAMVNRQKVESRLDTITSVQYQVALALLSPDDLFDLRRLPPHDDAAHTALMRRVEVRGDKTLDTALPRCWGAAVEVVAEGQTLSQTVGGVAGERTMSWDRLMAKGEALLGRAGVPVGLGADIRQLASGFEDLQSLVRLSASVTA